LFTPIFTVFFLSSLVKYFLATLNFMGYLFIASERALNFAFIDFVFGLGSFPPFPIPWSWSGDHGSLDNKVILCMVLSKGSSPPFLYVGRGTDYEPMGGPLPEGD
jgi:hypothetical protein